MNCLDVRRFCLVEPASHNPRLMMHIYHCKPCRQYRKRVLEAEQNLRSAMAVPVPEGLGRRIVFDTEFDEPARRQRPVYLALAAVVAAAVIGLAAVINLQLWAPNVVPDLARHMVEDPLHMTPPQGDARLRLKMVMRDLGAAWQGPLPENLSHATLCLVRKQSAAHLVVQGRQGPVTVFLMPDLRARKLSGLQQAQVVEVAELDGGSIALFGYQGEDLEQIQQEFAGHVRWGAAASAASEPLHLAQNKQLPKD